MPIYEYACENGHKFEVMHSVNKDVTECPECKGKVKRVPSMINTKVVDGTPKFYPR